MIALPQGSKISIDRRDALKVLAAADSGRVYKRQVEQLKADISILIQRIDEKESTIYSLTLLDSLNQKIFNTFSKEIEVMKEQRKLFESQIRKLKRRAFWGSVTGLAAITTLGVLYLTK